MYDGIDLITDSDELNVSFQVHVNLGMTSMLNCGDLLPMMSSWIFSRDGVDKAPDMDDLIRSTYRKLTFLRLSKTKGLPGGAKYFVLSPTILQVLNPDPLKNSTAKKAAWWTTPSPKPTSKWSGMRRISFISKTNILWGQQIFGMLTNRPIANIWSLWKSPKRLSKKSVLGSDS